MKAKNFSKVLLGVAALFLTTSTAHSSEDRMILHSFPRWIRCEEGSANWMQTAPSYSSQRKSAAFVITVEFPDGTTVKEPATGTHNGNHGLVEGWNYSVSWTTGGISLRGKKEGTICYSHKFDGVSPGFDMGGFPPGAKFRVRDSSTGESIDLVPSGPMGRLQERQSR